MKTIDELIASISLDIEYCESIQKWANQHSQFSVIEHYEIEKLAYENCRKKIQELKANMEANNER